MEANVPNHVMSRAISLAKTPSFWTAVSSLAACFAALFAAWATWETHEATRTTVLTQIINEYGSDEMGSSIRILRSWKRDHPADFDIAFKKLVLMKEMPEKEAKRFNEVDDARRHVSYFFEKLQTLCGKGWVDEEFIGAFWTTSTYAFISGVLIPIEKAKIDGLVEAGALTPADKAEAERVGETQSAFYKRVLHVSRQK